MKHIIMKQLFCILFWVVLSSPSVLYAQYTSVPDPILEQILILWGMDSDNTINGQVATSDLALITHLNLDITPSSSIVEIHDLTGLEDCSSLVVLKCTRHPITAINLANCTALDSLSLGKIVESKLDLSQMSQLSYLYSDSLQIDTLLLPDTVRQLQTLTITNSAFAHFTIGYSPALQKATLTSNNLTQIDLSSFPALEEVYLNNNNLSQINVRQNPLLKIITAPNNLLSQLDISQNPLLEEVDLSTNQLTNIDLSQALDLQKLYLSANPLQTLDLVNNVELGVFRIENMSTLSHLDVSPCKKLKGLFAWNNNLQTIQLNDTALLSLVLTSSSISEIDLSENINIEYIDLSNSLALSDVDLSKNTKIINFTSRGGIFSSMDFTSCPNLFFLHIEGNQNLHTIRLANDNVNFFHPFWIPNSLRICIFQEDSIDIIGLGLFLSPNIVITNDCYANKVVGKIALDSNYNCVIDRGEQLLSYRKVEFTKAGSTPHIATTDTAGQYQVYLDTGTYSARIIHPNAYQTTCLPTQTIVLDTFVLFDTLDWRVQDTIDCVSMWVDISAPMLRAVTSSYYVVNYCNHGTIVADSAYLVVELDSSLTYLNSTLPLNSQVGQTLNFDLGMVGAGVCQRFFIYVQLDTAVTFQQTHCTRAHIYPDTLCSSDWTGADLEVEGLCLVDSINFIVHNSAAAMTQPTRYFVFEDNIMMRQGTLQLGAGATQVINQVVTSGKTYRLSVEQEAGFPAVLGDVVVTAALEGCKPLPNGSFNTGFITQFSNGSTAPFLAVDCQQNVGSYDPNDKAAQPVGYHPLYHYIEKNTALDYKIRFQNTGTDTAFNIMILDTISPLLDLTTLQMGASSHDYTWAIEEGYILRLYFRNIMLPDSNVNEPLSNGFFRYRIEQVNNNPLGSVINNQAAIYFDYNPPIFTNTTFHTIGENFITAQFTNTQLVDNQLDLNIYPNPFTHSTTLEIKDHSYEQLEVHLYDVSGRLVAQHSNSGTKVEVPRNQLTQGIYFYELKGDGQRLATGKVIVK